MKKSLTKKVSIVNRKGSISDGAKNRADTDQIDELFGFQRVTEVYIYAVTLKLLI